MGNDHSSHEVKNFHWISLFLHIHIWYKNKHYAFTFLLFCLNFSKQVLQHLLVKSILIPQYRLNLVQISELKILMHLVKLLSVNTLLTFNPLHVLIQFSTDNGLSSSLHPFIGASVTAWMQATSLSLVPFPQDGWQADQGPVVQILQPLCIHVVLFAGILLASHNPGQVTDLSYLRGKTLILVR